MPGIDSLIAVSTGSLYSYGLNRAFEVAAMAGFGAVEVLIDQRWDTRQVAYLQRLSRETGVEVVSLHSPFVNAVQGWPADQLGRLKASVELAREVGARHVVVHLPFRFGFVWVTASWLLERPAAIPLPAPRRDAEYARFLQEDLAKLEEASGVTVAVENLPCRRLGGLVYNGYRLNTPAEWGKLPHLNLDTTHLATWGLDILGIYEAHKHKIRHTHLSNYNGKEHRLPWDGEAPLGELLRRMARDQFDGIVCVELDPEPLEAADEEKVVENLRRSYAFCAEHLEPPE